MSYWTRKYFILRTVSGPDAIGVVSILCPTDESVTFSFSLHRPENKHKNSEFLDLNHTEIPYSEFETHKDVFETVDEVEAIKEWTTSSLFGINVLVRKIK